MTNGEAKLILQACRPNGMDTKRADIAHALSLAKTDPELGAWWEAQRSFDLKIIDKLAEIPVPAELRDAILSAKKIETFGPLPGLSTYLAAAAAIAILCVAGTFYAVFNYGPLDRADYVDKVLPLLGRDTPNLAITTPNREEILAWLQAEHSPVGSLPPTLVTMPTLGCQKYTLNGHRVTLMCFAMKSGHVAHLFIVDSGALSDPPHENSPEFGEAPGGWSTASWSNGGMSYLLATLAPGQELHDLL